MKNIVKFFVVILSLFAISACSTIYSPSANVNDLDKIDFSDIETMKKGKSCSTRLLLIFGPFGKSTLFDATKEARIRRVRFTENKVTSLPMEFLPLYRKSCIVAYGE